MLLAGLAVPAHAQSLAPDRPGSDTRAGTVAGETLQAELGYAYNHDRGFFSHEVGQLLLRYGVNAYLELRANINSYVVTEDDAGYGGPGFGAKVQAYATGWMGLGVATTIDLPTGNDPFGGIAERPRQDLRLIAESTLGRLTLLVNGGTRFYFDADPRRQWLFIPALRARLTDRTYLHLGHAGFYRDGAEARWAEVGLSLRLAPRTLLDVNTGFRLDADERFFFGTGVAHRF